MFEWNLKIQKMVDWIEDHITEAITLEKMSEQLNYSPFYCTKQFHSLTGMSLRDYMRLRRVTHAALELRDTNGRILDIAVKYCFSSQEAFTRAFAKAYGITPKAYRNSPKPIPLLLRRGVFNPYILGIGERCCMSKEGLKQVHTKIEVLPAHKFIGIKNMDAKHYFHFWSLQDEIPGQDCHTVTGYLESIKEALNDQVGGWYLEGENRGYLYGVEVPLSYNSEIPPNMICIEIPESQYVIFYHPPYEYNDINDSVMKKVDDLAWNWVPEAHGYNWNEDNNPIYQRSNPIKHGYAICRPIKPIHS